MATSRAWLLAYDIAGQRRRQRLHYRLRKRAVFVQESVAVLHADARELDALLQQLRNYIDPRRDDLRVYRVEWPGGAWLSGPHARGTLLLATAPDPETKPRRAPGRPRRGTGLAQRIIALVRG
jgi:CRISPR-associated endonuclease Cas2